MNNPWLLAAAVLLAMIGIVHSVLGEQRIFRPWDTAAPAGLRRAHGAILRASWHLPSLLGWSQAAMLWQLGRTPPARWPDAALVQALLGAMGIGVAACGLLVLWLTRGRHPGGAALLLAAGLIAGALTRLGV